MLSYRSAGLVLYHQFSGKAARFGVVYGPTLGQVHMAGLTSAEHISVPGICTRWYKGLSERSNFSSSLSFEKHPNPRVAASLKNISLCQNINGDHVPRDVLLAPPNWFCDWPALPSNVGSILPKWHLNGWSWRRLFTGARRDLTILMPSSRIPNIHQVVQLYRKVYRKPYGGFLK